MSGKPKQQSPMSSRKQAKERSKSLIMRAATNLFCTVGYEGTSIRRLCQECNRSTGSIFMIWSGKDELWRDVMGCEPPTGDQLAKQILECMDDSLIREITERWMLLRHGFKADALV